MQHGNPFQEFPDHRTFPPPHCECDILAAQAGKVIHTFDAIQHDESGRVKYHYVIVDLLAEALDPTQPLKPFDDVQDARWFTLPDVEKPDLPISEMTRVLLRKVMNGRL